MKELKWWEGCEMFPHPLLVKLSCSFRKCKVNESWYFCSFGLSPCHVSAAQEILMKKLGV